VSILLSSLPTILGLPGRVTKVRKKGKKKKGGKGIQGSKGRINHFISTSRTPVEVAEEGGGGGKEKRRGKRVEASTLDPLSIHFVYRSFGGGRERKGEKKGGEEGSEGD